jgi:hypothetical protein
MGCYCRYRRAKRQLGFGVGRDGASSKYLCQLDVGLFFIGLLDTVYIDSAPTCIKLNDQ